MGIFHHSRLTNLFSIIVFFYYLINKKIFVFFLITSLIIFISYFLYNYLPNNFIFIIKLYLKDFYKILKITYWHIIDFNFSDLDSGRYNQLLALLSYCIDNPISAIFGNVTSFHKYGLKEYIEFDSTNVLRPIGIVRLIYDWGIIIFALITFIMIKQIIRNLKKITSYVNFLYYLMIPLCFYFSITITDMTTSILFWLFIFNLKYD